MASQFGGIETSASGASKFGGIPETKQPTPQQRAEAGTGSVIGDAFTGIGSGVIGSGLGLYDIARKIPGADKVLPAPSDEVRALAVSPSTFAGRAGHFLEQAAEFAVPAAKVGSALRGAGLLARMGGQAAVGAGVSAAQSGGDPVSTAVGGALGAGSEAAGAVVQGAKSLLAAKSPTLANFAESFGGATPTQKARITKSLDVLTKDGIVPPDSVHETQDVIKGKLDELAQAYQNLDPAIKAREVNPATVLAELRKAQGQYTRRGVVTNDAAHRAIEDQIGKVQAIADANGGLINVDDLVHMKQNANGRTNFQSPAVEKSLWNNIGDAYRKAADVLAPETTPLNQDFQKYKDLEQIIDQNIERGKGTTPSGLDNLMKRAAQHGTGAAAGAAVGGAVLGPVGAGIGSIAGGIIGPKVGKAAAQALQNAVDSGTFSTLSPLRQGMIRTASAIGDNAAILKMLGVAATEESAVQR